MKINHLFFVLLIMLMYGSAYPVGKIGTNLIPPLLMGSLRVLFLFIFILPFFSFKIPRYNFSILIFFSVVMGFFVYGLLYLALDFSSLIAPIIIGTQMAVPFGLILSLFILREKISFKKWILIFFSFIGIIILAYDPRFGNELLGLLMIVIMAFFYALANILSRFLKDIDTMTQMGWHCIIGFILLIFCSYIFEGNPIENLIPINYSAMITVIHASLFVSLIGHGGLFYLYKFYHVSSVLPFYSLFPIFGLILTFFIFLEIPGIFEIVGGTIVVCSVYLIYLENKKKA